MSIRNAVPRRYDNYEGCPFGPELAYPVDGETLRRIWWVCHRLYDESAPLRGDDQRDLAQFLDGALGHIPT
jgi:hypothetical protein